MSDTPRVDAECRRANSAGSISNPLEADFARQLERELNSALDKVAKYERDRVHFPERAQLEREIASLRAELLSAKEQIIISQKSEPESLT